MAKTEIEELIDAAKAQMRKWQKPGNKPDLTNRNMDELLDSRTAPKLRIGRVL